MNNTILDLRQDLTLDIFLNKGVIYYPSISNIPVLDSQYEIIIDENGDFENIYTIGNGLTLESSTRSIIWEINTNSYDIGVYDGVLESQSNIAGIYLKIKIKLHVE